MTNGMIGLPDYIFMKPGKLSEDEIKAYCRQTLAEYKVPHIVEFRGELPKTDVGKVSRRELRDESKA